MTELFPLHKLVSPALGCCLRTCSRRHGVFFAACFPCGLTPSLHKNRLSQIRGKASLRNWQSSLGACEVPCQGPIRQGPSEGCSDKGWGPANLGGSDGLPCQGAGCWATPQKGMETPREEIAHQTVARRAHTRSFPT